MTTLPPWSQMARSQSASWTRNFLLCAHGLNDRSFLGWLEFSSIMFQAVFRSFNVVHQCAPDKIIGFGGYGAFPVVMAGSLMRCPVLIHEQNVLPGKANTLLSKIVKKVAISFEGSRKYINPAKAVWTGCPCRYSAASSRSEGLLALCTVLDYPRRPGVMAHHRAGPLHPSARFQDHPDRRRRAIDPGGSSLFGIPPPADQHSPDR